MNGEEGNIGGSSPSRMAIDRNLEVNRVRHGSEMRKKDERNKLR